jgi:tRNA (guanine-N7-)-methyltransferase
MLPFYGRKLSRKTKNFDVNELKRFKYFFDEGNFEKVKKERRLTFLKKNLEIGFGSGENVLFQSLRKKDEVFLACDPFISGSEKLKKKIDELGADNLYFTDLDFYKLHNLIKTFIFKRIFILFPDPWPKKKHKKRRLINNDFVDTLSAMSSKDTQVVVATDHEGYSTQVIKSFLKDRKFKLALHKINQLVLNDLEIYPTKYFMKARNEKKIVNFFLFKK